MASAKDSRSDLSGRVLEKVDRKAHLDDTIPISANIVTYKDLQHVEYVIRVQRGPNPEEHWDVNHRYSEFDLLNQTLRSFGYMFTLPPKKLSKGDRVFLAERQKGLQAFLDNVLLDPLLMLSLPVRRFLDPSNYSENFHATALQNVSMFFRSNPEWKIVEPFNDIGWRIRKHYYLIASKVDPKAQQRMLSLTESGPDFNIEERELEVLLKILVELKHPNILSPSTATYSRAGLFVARDYCPAGTLREKIYNVPPGRVKTSYLNKYSQPARSRIDYPDIRRYGRNILDALKYLLDRGFVLGHVHSGNVIIVDNVCKLTDLENSLLGIPPYYRTFLTELRKIQGPEPEAVYAFGHLLYEMCCGRPLKTATMEAPPTEAHPEMAELLNSLLSPGGIKLLPTIADLLGNLLFKDVVGTTGLEKPSLKVPSRLKEVLRTARERYDSRLLDNQRKVSQFRRMSKAHDSLMTAEKKSERKKKIRKQMSLMEQKDTPEAYPTTKLKKQSTISSSQPSKSPSSTSKTSAQTQKNSATTAAAAATPAPTPTSTQPPESRPAPPTGRNNNEHGALLGSIESFSKNKLKKSVTNDRSAPVI